MIIPTIPTLPAGQVVHAADLNNIAAACTFLLTKPCAHVHDATGGHAITTAFSSLTFPVKDFDTDGLWASGNSGRLTTQTPGFYKYRYSVQIASTSTGRTINTQIRATTGANNPLGSGIAIGASVPGYVQVTQTGATSYCSGAGIYPFYLYQGDYMQVQVSADATGATTGIDSGMPLSSFSCELVSI